MKFIKEIHKWILENYLFEILTKVYQMGVCQGYEQANEENLYINS